jgi:hypothetical protein
MCAASARYAIPLPVAAGVCVSMCVCVSVGLCVCVCASAACQRVGFYPSSQSQLHYLFSCAPFLLPALSEEAVRTYTRLIHDLNHGLIPEWTHQPVPDFAKDYWQLSSDAKFVDLIVREHTSIGYWHSLPCWQ